MSILRLDRVRIRWEHDEMRPGTYGCFAVAEVSYQMAGTNDRRLQQLQSGGLWGISATESPEYRREIELDELANLVVHLNHFHVYTTMQIVCGMTDRPSAIA